MTRRRVLLAQLPIPPAGPVPIHGNVPLAATYLKLLARRRGLESAYEIDLFPPPLANTLSDAGLVEAILARDPWLVGFTCYLWNIDRTLWVVERLKARRPDLKVVIGGPEITADNRWVLEQPGVDYAAIGEGEQTFAELLTALSGGPDPFERIAGLHRLGDVEPPPFRQPLANIDEVSSPYLEGILDAADERLMLLETIRGCIFKCKFCYYPKSYDALYFASQEKVVAGLRHAAERGARDVVLLDPTLNQRRDFADFCRLLGRCNPDRQFRYFGELRAEGIAPEIARLLREANFTEVEIGLQSVDRHAQTLMDRTNNMKAFERGVRSLMDAGISVKVDMIVGLPGDTADSVRRGFDYLHRSGLYSDVQVFNLAILPGTAFRQEASELGLTFQPRPPYYVLNTPTLDIEQLYGLMREAQDLFGIEFDPFPPPQLVFSDDAAGPVSCVRVDLDAPPRLLPSPAKRAQALTLWFRSSDLDHRRERVASCIRQVLDENPHSTLQVVLEPAELPPRLSPGTLEHLLRACYGTTNYLDRYHGLNPAGLMGSKRLVVALPARLREAVGADWIGDVGEFAAIAWRGGGLAEAELDYHEHMLV